MTKHNTDRNVHFHDAKRAIADGMESDQYRLNQELTRLVKLYKRQSNEKHDEKWQSLWQTLQKRITQSKQKRELRLSHLPKIHYPKSLPVASQRERILKAIHENQVVIICGETGSGKSTQLPKFLLEAGYGVKGMIAHTQPRRIAARSLATRIAEELGSDVGKMVGYKVRFNDVTSAQTYIKLLTDGMLLNEMSDDRFLNQYDAIIIDEAHERSLNIDILLGLLNSLIKKRPHLKLIITSATINSDIFANFFARFDSKTEQITKAPVIEVSGRTYPVTHHYRPLDPSDYKNHSKEDAWLAHAKKITEQCINAHNGDVLFFLPTEREINDVFEYFNKHLRHHIERLNVKVLRLFARLPLVEQQQVLHPNSQGKHTSGTRIILTTNIAETSLTVPNIRYVIDSGTARLLRFNPSRRISQLPIEKISQSSANQRSGRSGRVQDGICYRLYDEDDFQSRPLYSQAEITRSSLTDVILKLKSLRLDANTFQWLEAPQQRLINEGLRQLTELGALDADHQLTPLGKQLSQIPIDTRIARILLASIDYQCFNDIAVIAAFLSSQDPRIINNDNRSQAIAAQKIFEHKDSDFMILLNIWQQYQKNMESMSKRKLRAWCEQHFLSHITLNECRLLITDFKRIAKQLNLNIEHSSRSIDNIHKSLLTGFVSNIAKREPHYQGSGELYQGCYDKKVRIFPGSCLSKKKPNWIISADQIETSALFARIVAVLHPRWIEECASHLIHHEYLSPFWNAERGEVSCQVKKSLFGIMLSNNSITNYGKINPKHSQEMLIQSCLMPLEEHDIFDDDNLLEFENNRRSPSQPSLHHNQLDNAVNGTSRHPSIDKIQQHDIIKANHRLFAQIEAQENTLRHNNIRVSDDILIQWFANKLSNKIVSSTQLFSFLQSPAGESLRLQRHDLCPQQDSNSEHSDTQHPKVLTVMSKNHQAIDLSVNYLFDIGSNSDGITVEVLISQLNQLQPKVFEWLIPAWLNEKIEHSLRALNKPIKQKLPPIKNMLERLNKQLSDDLANTYTLPKKEGLYEYISRFIKNAYQVDISQQLQSEYIHPYLAPYLKVHFQLIDTNNDIIDRGDDLYQLQIKYHQLSQQALQSSTTFSEIEGATTWVFGEIPKKISTTHNGQVVDAFPTLMDDGDSVRYCLTHNIEESYQYSQRAITRLLILNLPQQVNYITKKLPDLKPIMTLYSPIGSSQNLVKTCLFTIFSQTFFPQQSGPKSGANKNSNLPMDEASFLSLIESRRDRLLTYANEHLALVLSILTSYQHCRSLANKLESNGFELISEDIHEHLDWLVYDDFLEETPLTWLKQFPRYLKAVELRCERAQTNPQKDQQKTQTLSRYWQAYLDTLVNHSEQIENVDYFSEFGWAVEEFRLSLYAQEMKTVMPVSEKKLQSLWQQATNRPLPK